MEKTLKITPSLYSAYYYLINGYGTEEDFIKLLNKVKTPPNEAMLKGLAFEKAVQAEIGNEDRSLISDDESLIKYDGFPELDAKISKYEPFPYQLVYEAARMIEDGDATRVIFQLKVEKNLHLFMGGQNLSETLKGPNIIKLSGVLDAINRDVIYDIKLTSKYDLGKYEYSIQHLLYMYCSGSQAFHYIISDNRDTYKESYFWNAESPLLLRERISDLLRFIFAKKCFYEPYKKNWIEPYKNIVQLKNDKE
jgi:hypothetical protein